jgi:hypothetical protein
VNAVNELFSVLISGGVMCVRIKEMVVPPILRNGTEEFVILDCDYEIEESEKKGLMVKWFFKELRLPVYQWIPNQSPQDLGILRGRVSLDYKAHQDKHKMYRALKITRPTVELSGEPLICITNLIFYLRHILCLSLFLLCLYSIPLNK